jgi:Domain of unknown function (DUF4112)
MTLPSALDPRPRSSGPDAALDVRRRQTDLGRALAVAKWTDSRFFDPLLGFILPGVGDILGAVAGLYIVAIAVRHDTPRTVVARMLINLSVDCVAGVIPIVGDLFDVFNRANLRNARLLQQHLASPPCGRGRFRIRTLALPIALLAGAIAVALGVAYLVVSRWMH